jgi:phospholipid/cholesterol/gamma-HCH transport system substrate-binding protein
MGKKNFIQTVKIGIFTVIGLSIMTTLIFYIGSREKAFGAKKKVTVTFKNVSGLKTGNAVRFAGVTIGSVDKIQIISDSAVLVTLVIDADDSKFVKKDSKVSISTEGLLGSKYLKVTSGSSNISSVEDGDHLATLEPVDFDEILSVLNESGNNMRNITGKVDQIVNKINTGEGLLGAIISDTTMNEKFDHIVNTFATTWHNANKFALKMIETVDTFKIAGGNTVKVSRQLEEFSKKLNNDSSTLGKIISDTTMARQINTAIVQMQSTASEVEETSSRVKESWIVNLFGKKNKNKKKK